MTSRCDGPAQLGALAATAALPRPAWSFADRDPLDGTIAEYVAGICSGRWSAAEATVRAPERAAPTRRVPPKGGNYRITRERGRLVSDPVIFPIL